MQDWSGRLILLVSKEERGRLKGESNHSNTSQKKRKYGIARTRILGIGYTGVIGKYLFLPKRKDGL